MTKRRVLLVLLVGFLGWSLLATSNTARGETYAGSSGSKCDTTAHTVFSMPLDGTVASAEISQAKLVVDAGTVVRGYWVLSNGTSPGTKYWQGPGTFFSWYGDGKVGSAYLRINLVQGTTGTLRFVLVKTGQYGECWTASNIGVRVLRFSTGNPNPPPGGGGPSPDPSPTPSPTQPPSASPSASPAPGWCVDPDYDPTRPGTGAYIPCETAAPSATPSPAANIWTCSRPFGASGFTGSQSCTGAPPVLTAMTQTLTWSNVLSSAGSMWASDVKWSTTTDGNVGAQGGTCAGGRIGFQCGTNSATRTGSYTPTLPGDLGTVTATLTGQGECCAGGNVGTLTSSMTWTITDSAATPSPSPAASPSGGATLPPSFAPSLPPPPYAQDGDGDGTPDEPAYSIAPASIDPGGVAQLVEQLKGKAPFGYAYQAVDALTGATANAAGSSAAFGCQTVPLWHPGGTQEVEWCIPWNEMAATAAPVRFVFLAIVVIVFAVAYIRLARSTAAGGT